MVPSLPSELVMKIIGLAYYAHVDSMFVDVQTMAACAAVCKEWSTIARKLLFFEVNLAFKSNRRTKDTTLLLGAGGLGAYIRSITVFVSRKPDSVVLDFIDVVSYCPALYQLDLYFDSHALELTEFEIARLIALPITLRALRFTSYNQQKSRLVYQLMAIWPTIQFLALEVHASSLAPPPAERPPFSLYELRINRILPYPESVIRWLLPPIPTGQRGSLRILSIPLLGDPTFMEYAPYVRALAVSCQFPRNAELIARFSALEELFLSNLDMVVNEFDARAADIPKTIQHLRFGIFSRFSAKNLRYLDALMDAGLPRLRRVSINKWIQYEAAQSLDLAAVCGKRGVELVIGESYRWQLEYLVPADHFPRDWTIENLYRMNAG